MTFEEVKEIISLVVVSFEISVKDHTKASGFITKLNTSSMDPMDLNLRIIERFALKTGHAV